MVAFLSVLLSAVGILALLAGVIGAIGAKILNKEIGGPVLIAGCGLVLLFLCSISITGTRNTAVQISFGRPLDTQSNGMHLIRPWSYTESYDGSLQILSLRGDKAPQVRLANGSTAWVDMDVQWEIDPKADITQIHLDYKDFDNISPNVVDLRARSAANAVFNGYDPIATVKGGKAQIDLVETGAQIATGLRQTLPSQLLVRAVIVLPPRFSKETEDQILKLAQSKTETEIAAQQLLTADLQRQTNNKLAEANTSPGVLFQNCLNMTERQSQQGHTISMAWTCGAPSNPLGLAITSAK